MMVFPFSATGRTTTDLRSALKPSLLSSHKTHGTPFGWHMWHRKRLSKIYLDLSSSGSWTAIFGDEDTGILLTARKLIQRLGKEERPIILLDLVGIMGSAADHCATFEPSDMSSDLVFNIFEMHFSEDESEEIEIATRIFTESLELTQGQSQILWEALRSTYRRKRRGDLASSRHPMSTIIAEIQRKHIPRSTNTESLVLLKKMVTLAEGKSGKILNSRDSNPTPEFLRQKTLIQLGELGDIQLKRLLVSLLLASLTQAISDNTSEMRSHLPLLVLIEGGPTLVERQEGQGMNLQYLQDLRKKGMNLLIIQASPRKTPLSLVEQCQTRIAHRLTNQEDLDLTQKILNLTDVERDLLQELSDDEVLMRTSDHPQPFLAHVSDHTRSTLEMKEGRSVSGEDVLEIVYESDEEER